MTEVNPELEGCIQTHDDLVRELESAEQQLADEYSLKEYKEHPLRLRSKLLRMDMDDQLEDMSQLVMDWRSLLTSFIHDMKDGIKSKYWGQENPRDQMRTIIGAIKGNLLNHEGGIIDALALSDRVDPLLFELEQLSNWMKEDWKNENT